MLEARDTPKGKVVTTGYTAIEKLLDTEDFSQINAEFGETYKALEDIVKVKRGLKKSREAKKAMRAIELVMNLFKELLEIKYKIQLMLKTSQKKRV